MPNDRTSEPRQVSPSSYRRITVAALAAQVVIVLSGAAVRLTGSGLGCSDWPNCSEDRLVAPLEFNPMIEFINRCVSFVVVATVALAIWGALRRVPYRRDLLNWSYGLLALTAVQVVIGAITVRTHLSPPVVMTHFLLSMVLIWMAVVLHHRAVFADQPDHMSELALQRTGRLMPLLFVAAAAILVTGTIVTGSGPHGGDEFVDRLGFYVPTVTRVHTTAVFVFLALLVATLLILRRSRRNEPVMRAGMVVLAAAVAQGTLGYYQYFNGVPAFAVFLHVGGAMAVWATTVWFVLEHRRHDADQPRSERAGADASHSVAEGPP